MKRAVILGILGCALIIRLYSIFQNDFLGIWDEAFHAVVASNLSHHMLLPTLYDDPVMAYNPHHWFATHIWLHKPPLMLWLIALSIKVFGRETWAVRLPSALMSTLAVWFAYLLFRRLTNHRQAALVALLLAFNSFQISLINGRNPTDHIDTGLNFFILLGLLFLVVSLTTGKTIYCLGTGIATGMAIMVKSVAGLFPLALVPLLLWKMSLKRFIWALLLILFTTLVIALPWNLYAYYQWPDIYSFEFRYSLLHLNQILEGHAKPWYFFFSPIVLKNYYVKGGPFFLLFPVGLLLYAWNFRQHHGRELTSIFITIWIFIPLCIFSLSRTKLMSYCVYTIPAGIFIMIQLLEKATEIYRLKYRPHPRRWVRILSTTIVIILWWYPVQAITWELYQQVSGAYLRHSPDLTYYDDMDFKRKVATLSRIEGKKVIFNVKEPYHLYVMFKTGASVYSFVPIRETLMNIAKDHKVIIIKDSDDRALSPSKINNVYYMIIDRPRTRKR